MTQQHKRVSTGFPSALYYTNRSSFRPPAPPISHIAIDPSTPRRLTKPVPEVPEDKRGVYDAFLANHDMEKGAAKKYGVTFPRGVAIVPTAVSGGGDIMCAVKLAVELRNRGVTPISIIVKEGSLKGRNAAVIDKIRGSDIAAGITILELDELPRDFVMPDMILAGPGAGQMTESGIATELSAKLTGKKGHFDNTRAAQFFSEQNIKYLQLEEPGFIEGQYKFNVDLSRQTEMSATSYGLGLPVTPGLGRPITDSFSQAPERLLGLKNEWLKSQILGESPESAVSTYSDTRMLSLIYHHIDTVFERSLYFLAAASSEDSRDIDIVAKVWDPSKPIATQVAWTLIKYLEPRNPGVPTLLDKSLLAEFGVGKVVMVRPDKTEELVISDHGKTIRIIDPFPLAADDMEIVRDAAIPIQGCSGLMSVSRNIELNKIPLIEVLHDNRHFFAQLLPIAEQIDPTNTGLALYFKLSESLIQTVLYSDIKVFDAMQGMYVLPSAPLGEIDRSAKVSNSRGRAVSKYVDVGGDRAEVLVNSEVSARATLKRSKSADRFNAPMIQVTEPYLADPVAAFQKMGELLRSPEFHRQVTQFNRFIAEECSLYDRLTDKIAYTLRDRGPELPPSGGCLTS